MEILDKSEVNKEELDSQPTGVLLAQIAQIPRNNYNSNNFIVFVLRDNW